MVKKAIPIDLKALFEHSALTKESKEEMFEIAAGWRRIGVNTHWTINGRRKSVPLWLLLQIESGVVQALVMEQGWRDLETDDIKAHAILKWVKQNVKYTTDIKENWQQAYETILRKRGDCEDGAILITVLCFVAGVNPVKIDFAWGAVLGGGHAYVIYITDLGKEVLLDWCYWYESIIVKLRNWFSTNEKYFSFWGKGWIPK